MNSLLEGLLTRCEDLIAAVAVETNYLHPVQGKTAQKKLKSIIKPGNRICASMKALRVICLHIKANPLFLQSLVSFSSSPVTSSRFSDFNSNSFEGDDVEGVSGVYQHALKCQRPPVINVRDQWKTISRLENSACFIGTVVREVQIVHNKTLDFGVYTLLNVRTSASRGSANSPRFTVFLVMWKELAESALRHLEPDDVIFVSGRLASYKKVNGAGDINFRYKVVVKEFDYIAQGNQLSTYLEDKVLKSNSDGSENRETKLHLWQIFFANPYEWRDLRKRKVNPKQPDFKHLSTGEALWLGPNNPPWVERQLQLLDSRRSEDGENEYWGSRRRVTEWTYDE